MKKSFLTIGFIFWLASSVAVMFSPLFTNFWFPGYGNFLGWEDALFPLLYFTTIAVLMSQSFLYGCVLEMVKQNESKFLLLELRLGKLADKLQENDDEQTNT